MGRRVGLASIMLKNKVFRYNTPQIEKLGITFTLLDVRSVTSLKQGNKGSPQY